MFSTLICQEQEKGEEQKEERKWEGEEEQE